jgi:ABC-2 type transport system permease protein
MISLFGKYSKMLMKARFQYKLDAFLLSFAVFLRESVGIIVVYLTLSKFATIKGWNKNEMFFLFSFLFLTYSILIFFFTGVRDFDGLVYSGEFDRFLLRPLNLLFQVIASKADYFASIGHGTLGIILFLKAANSVGVIWDFRNVVYCIMAIIGGVMIQASILMVFSCMSFWFVKTDNLKNFLYYNSRRFAGYPISIYPDIIQKLLIFIIPFAFVNYFPAQFLLRKNDLSAYWDGFIYLTPLIGILMFAVVYMFWKLGLRHYSSTGN